MEDTSVCPICNSNLRIKQKYDKWIEKICTEGPNHRGLKFITNVLNKQIAHISIPLNEWYSVWVNINFVNEHSTILVNSDLNIKDNIELDKLLVPDFPNLINLKKIVSLCLTFS